MAEQLIKKTEEGHSNVMPKSWIEAITDKSTGESLTHILQGFNMYFLSYTGNTEQTRCQVPKILRKKGLWITYVKYDGNVYTEWYNSNNIDDKSWGNSSNWRIGNNELVGDLTISANGNWVINGKETEFKAVGEKGNTPLIRIADNKLQVSYDGGDTYNNVSDNPVYTKFRWQSSQNDNIGNIQFSVDGGKTWKDFSSTFVNNLHIAKYIGANETLPTNGVAEGTIYAKGPTYADSDTSHNNPIYRLWVYAYKGDTLAWQDNGEFTSIAAGIIQETGDSETKVMSQKAVTKKLSELGKKINGFSQKEVDEEGLYLCNENGEVLLRLDILDTKNPIGDNMISYITKYVKKEIISPCIEEGFYICNENGEAIAQYKNNDWQFIGIEKEVKINPCYSSLGLESGVIKANTLSNGELVLMDYPQYLKRNATVSFGAKIDTFSQVKVGVKGGYFCLAQIDSSNISILHNTGTIKTEAHGLNISGWIDVVLKVEELNVEISIHSLDGYKKITANLPFRELYGRPTVEVDENTTLTDVSLRGYCDDFQKSIWFVGDSYTSCTEVRWTGQMLDFGITNWMLLGLAGGKSKDLYEDLLLALKYGTPTYLVWCMGMNDADKGSLNADYKKYFELVKEKCDELGVVMIPATVPCVKTTEHPTTARDNSYKNEYIKTSGMRYIDLAKAVGGDTFTDDAWYDGYLETISPWIHTTELGAKAQMAQIIRDFPEILRNK